MSRNVFLGALACALAARPSSAQGGIVTATAPLAGTLSTLWSPRPPGEVTSAAGSLTVNILAGATQTIASLVENAVNTFPGAVTITTSWSLASIVSSIDLVGYFTSPSAALVNGASTLASSRVLGRMRTGSATRRTPFTQNGSGAVGTPGGSLLLFRQNIAWPVNAVGSRTDDLQLYIDLRGLTGLAPGTYAGTLHLRAITF